MPSAREEIRNEMEKLTGQNGVLGMFLISRDGINVVDVSRRPVNHEMVAAMSAMMMGAAETAVAEVGDRPPTHVVAETEDAKLLVMGATEDLLLAVLGEAGADFSRLRQKMGPLVTTVKKLAE